MIYDTKETLKEICIEMFGVSKVSSCQIRGVPQKPDCYVEPNICIYFDDAKFFTSPKDSIKAFKTNQFLMQRNYTVIRIPCVVHLRNPDEMKAWFGESAKLITPIKYDWDCGFRSKFMVSRTIGMHLCVVKAVADTLEVLSRSDDTKQYADQILETLPKIDFPVEPDLKTIKSFNKMLTQQVPLLKVPYTQTL